MMSELDSPNHVVSLGNSEDFFWRSAEAGRLVLARCASCDAVTWYSRYVCGACHGTEIEWVDAMGIGTVYSFTTVRHATHPFLAGSDPYLVAYIELTEGPRVLANLVDIEPHDVQIGMKVRTVFGADERGKNVLQFGPLARTR